MKEFFLNKNYKLIFLSIFLIELLSFYGYLFSDINQIVFILICLIFAVFSFVDLKYGILILLTELFIGSKGYLFYFDCDGTVISIRIALWIIILSIWLTKKINEFVKTKKIEINFKKSSFYYLFLLLFAFIVFGLINGAWQKNSFSDIFLDFNNWLYFLIIFPLYDLLKNKKALKDILSCLFISSIWLSFKSLFLFFIFSHNINLIKEFYGWIRNTGVGEITLMKDNFYRVFIQSQSFILISFFSTFFWLDNFNKKENDKKNILILFLVNVLFFSVIFLSWSRSFWVGLICGFFCYFILKIFVYKQNIKKVFYSIFLFILIFLSSSLLIVSLLKFPYPDQKMNIDASGALLDRISNTQEAGASSRWVLFKELKESIKDNFILGRGFGASISYKSSDPRIVESTVDGQYTTYAFEWGWLDIWLKLSLFGLLVYVFLFIKIVILFFKQKTFNLEVENKIIAPLIIGLIVLMAINIFTPYYNHPLGIGYLMIVSFAMDYFRLKI
jgi:hypothetical protein